jgi:hypothetical protein
VDIALPAGVDKAFCLDPESEEVSVPHRGLVFVDVFEVLNVVTRDEASRSAIIDRGVEGDVVLDSSRGAVNTG